MAGNREKPGGILMNLRQVDVLRDRGAKIADAVRRIGVTRQSHDRWRREHGDQLRRLKALGQENARLRRAVSDLTLDKLIRCRASPSTPKSS
ncbi:hypothetical protein [Rhodovulum sp. MB263]|uniref:hypothetical protein n=1 Tax=Rhodovulum sp. (strain MB263) TaxID=308754 RepID=UPI0012DB2CF7